MTDNRIEINNDDLEKVVGGMFSFNGDTMIMTYKHPDGSTTTHKILDGKKAWQMSNSLHAQLIPEDEILDRMIAAGYIEG